jgi:hypothetical protein
MFAKLIELSGVHNVYGLSGIFAKEVQFEVM